MKGMRLMRRNQVSKYATRASASPASLPPPGDAPVVAASVETPEVPIPSDTPPAEAKPVRPYWSIEKGSVPHQQAMRVLAMRVTGLSDKEIAAQLGVPSQTLRNYLHYAGRSGLLTEFANAREQLEYALVPKALREIDRALDDQARHQTSGMTVAAQMAIRVAEGTVMKEFNPVETGDATSTTIAVQVVMPEGALQTMRVDAIGGVPNTFNEGDDARVRE